MKTLPSLLLLGAVALPAALGCFACDRSAPATGSAAATAATALHSATLAIDGMTCGACSVTVRTAAKKLAGVAEVEVDVDAGQATVRFDPARVDAAAVAKAITDAGYPARVVSEQGA